MSILIILVLLHVFFLRVLSDAATSRGPLRHSHSVAYGTSQLLRVMGAGGSGFVAADIRDASLEDLTTVCADLSSQQQNTVLEVVKRAARLQSGVTDATGEEKNDVKRSGIYDSGGMVGGYRQILDGSFSAVSRPIFATKY